MCYNLLLNRSFSQFIICFFNKFILMDDFMDRLLIIHEIYIILKNIVTYIKINEKIQVFNA